MFSLLVFDRSKSLIFMVPEINKPPITKIAPNRWYIVILSLSINQASK